METYREIVERVHKSKKALAHFNFATIEVAHAIVSTAKEAEVPILLGLAEGERDFVGVKESVSLVESLRRTYSHDIFLNADHTYSFERVKEAIDAGFDSVIFDGAKLSLEDNIRITKQCVEYARSCGRDVIVEAEMGYIGQASAILDKIPEGAAVTEEETTKPEEAKRFVEETGIDFFAPSVGNIHGMMREGADPALHISRIKEISDSTKVPLVLHGASGNTDDDLKKAIDAGISIIHINTEIRRAWRDALGKHLTEHPDDVAPYKILKEAKEAVAEVVKRKIAVFNGR